MGRWRVLAARGPGSELRAAHPAGHRTSGVDGRRHPQLAAAPAAGRDRGCATPVPSIATLAALPGLLAVAFRADRDGALDLADDALGVPKLRHRPRLPLPALQREPC